MTHVTVTLRLPKELVRLIDDNTDDLGRGYYIRQVLADSMEYELPEYNLGAVRSTQAMNKKRKAMTPEERVNRALMKAELDKVRLKFTTIPTADKPKANAKPVQSYEEKLKVARASGFDSVEELEAFNNNTPQTDEERDAAAKAIIDSMMDD